jgi:putative NADPH-quinone reductase
VPFEGVSELKVLGIVGSPRRRGNTAALVEAVLEGAAEAGHEAEIFYLGELEVGPIAEEGGGLAYPRDDMERLYPHLESMGALVLGSPVYYDHVSSRTKLFIDRLHYYSETHGPEYRERFPSGVRFVAAITYEWDDPEAYDGVLEWMRGRMEHYWGMETAATLRAEGTHRRPISGRPELLEKARQVGRGL